MHIYVYSGDLRRLKSPKGSNYECQGAHDYLTCDQAFFYDDEQWKKDKRLIHLLNQPPYAP